MAEQFMSLDEKHTQFIMQQHMFFVASAAPQGRVNLSPKGQDTLRIVSPSQLVWLNLTGSGNETAAHVLQDPRMTVMFCAFERQPLILRVYGHARLIYPRMPEWHDLAGLFPPYPGARQVFLLDIDMVQTSCGFAVPFYEYAGQRETLNKWADGKGKTGIHQYWQEKNTTSLDGYDTEILPAD